MYCVWLQGEPGEPGPEGLQGPAGLPGARVRSNRCLHNKCVDDLQLLVQSSLFSVPRWPNLYNKLMTLKDVEVLCV